MFEDTCTFSCDHGYELSGSKTLTCQSDQTWNGTDVMCTPGKCVYIYHDDIGVYKANTVEPVYNGHLGTRYIWPLYTGGCYRENLHKVVSSILVAMTVLNE